MAETSRLTIKDENCWLFCSLRGIETFVINGRYFDIQIDLHNLLLYGCAKYIIILS